MKIRFRSFLTAISLFLSTQAFAISVPGWPNYLAMGTVTTNEPSIGNYLAQTPVDAIFKYAGYDGQGDLGIITDVTTEQKTVAQARYIEANSANHHPVMPVLVVYTIQLSNGLTSQDVTNDSYLRTHYINLINYCNYFQSQKDTNHPHPATIILNPDFLGMIEQNQSWSPLQPTTYVNVNQQLVAALSQANVNKIPPKFENNLIGYIQSINWIVRIVSPDVPFGWQENLWAKNSATWIYTFTPQQIITDQANDVANYIKQLGVYDGAYKPDFIVFDRYERDDFYVENTDWFYNRNNWYNYLIFVNSISRALNVPAMLWQIPGGHMLTRNENSPLTLDHVSTAPDFFFGDSKIGQNFQATLSPSVLNFPVLVPQYETAATHLASDKNSDWSQPELQTAIDSNVFAILWGGGGTTAVAPIGSNGDDGGWLAAKIQTYYKNPLALIKSK